MRTILVVSSAKRGANAAFLWGHLSFQFVLRSAGGSARDWCLLFLIILLFYWGIRGIFRQRAFSQCRRQLQACASTVFTWGCCGGFTKWINFRFTYYFIVFYIWRADSRIGKRRRILIPRKPVSRFVLILYYIDLSAECYARWLWFCVLLHIIDVFIILYPIILFKYMIFDIKTMQKWFLTTNSEDSLGLRIPLFSVGFHCG